MNIIEIVLIIQTCLVCGLLVQSARILGMIPFYPRSHHWALEGVLRTLAEAGHEVIVYSPFPLKDPPAKYTHVHLEGITLEGGRVTKFIQEMYDVPNWKCIDPMLAIEEMNYEETMRETKIKELLQSKEKFDLVVTEGYTWQEFTFIFGHIFKAPVIVIHTFFTTSLPNSNSGNSLSLSFLPDACLPYSQKMAFFERFVNSFAILRGLYYYYTWYLPRMDTKMRRDFPDMPPVAEMVQNASLIFVNDHLTADYAQPRTPNIIPIGGIHIPPQKPLPQNIKKFMDEAPEGVILFSLGTYVRDDLKPKEYFDMYINVFKKLRQRVLWKTRKENIAGLPDNVMTSKWMPQSDILAHQKCVLFITHGGLNSLLETVHFGVPVIGIPQFFDQYRNVMFYVEKGIGVNLENEKLSEKTVSTAIETVLGNPKYKENMKRLSLIFRDLPMTPAQSVVYWTEYVIRHKGAGHLKAASAGLPWYQLALVDVIAVITVVVILFLYTIYWIATKLLHSVKGNKSVSGQKRKNC